jgi:restriction endonuclease S subunit
MKLSELVKIKTGVSFRKGIKHQVDGVYDVVQMTNLSVEGVLDTDLARVDVPRLNPEHVLMDGDVLIISKGTNNRAVFFEKKKRPTVATSAFFILRRQGNLSPHYLSWFLNHPNTQGHFKKFQMGSTAVSLKKAVLEELDIPMPILRNQQRLGKIHELQNRERQLTNDIQTLREKYINAASFKIIDL